MEILDKIKNEHNKNIVFIDKFSNMKSFSYSTFYEKSLNIASLLKKIFPQDRKKL